MNFTFDIAWDCPIGDFLKAIKDHGLTLVSFIPIGPGGGNPEITLTGDFQDIQDFKSNFLGE